MEKFCKDLSIKVEKNFTDDVTHLVVQTGIYDFYRQIFFLIITII